jgi:hypothetical protein
VSLAAAEPPPGSPWWVYAAGFLVTVLVAYVAARGPVWVERAKQRIRTTSDPPAAVEKAPAASGEVVLREWLRSVERKNKRLEQRVDDLEAELYRRGWDGRLP